MNLGRHGPMSFVKNDRGDLVFKGKILDQDDKMVDVLKGLDIQSPVFVTTSKSANIFGQQFVVVPKGKHDVKYSPLIDDLTDVKRSKKSVEEIVKSYKSAIPKDKAELLLDVKGYYLVSLDEMFRRSPAWIQKEFKVELKNKETYDSYSKRVYNSVTTYKDLEKFFSLYDKYMKYMESQK